MQRANEKIKWCSIFDQNLACCVTGLSRVPCALWDTRAAYRNNVDNSSQRGQTRCLAEENTSKDGFGPMVDCVESHKMNRVAWSPNASELH